LDEEATLRGKPNSRITRVDKVDYRNKKGFTFLALCDNDQRVLNKGSIIVCLYNNAWHRIHYDSKLQRAYLGSLQPNIHYYNDDIKLPTESNVDSDEEPPTKKPKSDPPSEEEVLEPLHEDFAIRHASTDPLVLTPILQSLAMQCSNLPEEPLPMLQGPDPL
jgi:hypothetical protein